MKKKENGFEYITRHGLRLFPLKGLDRSRWLELRNMNGVLGGSDVGTIMGWNKYYSKIELFYQKIGLNFSNVETFTEPAYWGTHNEAAIMETAQFYDHDNPLAYLENRADGVILRKITSLKYSVRNPTLPYFNANVDGLIDFNPKTWIARRVAESKTISRQSAEMWETIPPYHLGQILVYLAVLAPILTEEVAEIFYLKDGNQFSGWEIQQSPTLLEMILERCKDFHERVVKGIEIANDEKNIEKRDAYLAELEPPPDTSEGYERFMSEAYKKKANYITVKGGDELFKHAQEYQNIGEKIKSLEDSRQLSKNNIWLALRNNSADVIDFGLKGKITYNKRLYVKTKSN